MNGSLQSLQAMVQDSILNRSDAALDHIKRPPKGSKKEALGIYEHAYQARLTEFLANDYEKLRAYIGEVRFNAMAADYAAAHPSRQFNARWFGQNLPAFLKSSKCFAQFPECAELADLELALATAFDAPDATSLDLSSLAALAGQDIANTQLEFHPSLQTLSFNQSTVSLWSALQCDEAPPRPHALDVPQIVMVWRQSGQSRLRLLGDEEAMALSSARLGVTFGGLCETLAFSNSAEDAAMRAATYLRTWIEAELLTSLQS